MPSPTHQTERRSPPPAPALHPWLRRAISAALAVHLLAVVVPPLAVEPSSRLAGLAWETLQPYIQATFLDHGYRFFAPEPGPSHLIRYELTMPDGSQRSGVFPDLKQHWPRLYYHRHFMLTEFVNSLDAYRPSVAKTYARSYARHLLRKHQAASVSLKLRRHVFPDPNQVLKGMKLDDPSLYQERDLGTFTLATDLESVPPRR